MNLIYQGRISEMSYRLKFTTHCWLTSRFFQSVCQGLRGFDFFGARALAANKTRHYAGTLSKSRITRLTCKERPCAKPPSMMFMLLRTVLELEAKPPMTSEMTLSFQMQNHNYQCYKLCFFSGGMERVAMSARVGHSISVYADSFGGSLILNTKGSTYFQI